MDEIVYFFSDLSQHLNTLVSYVIQSMDAVSFYVPAFFGSEIGALFAVVASIALVMVVVGR